MKVNMFIPEYMKSFKCIGSKCKDTCCAGWDINLDENTFNKYLNAEANFKKLIQNKFVENTESTDFFNKGFMKLREGNSCPFLNFSLLCDIHGNFGENELCITCKSYPRVFNIVDGVYEKSGLPSCEEICRLAFLNKNRMEFIETVEEIDEENIEIRRIIDTEAFEDEENIIEYFWEIRVASINIMQNRNFTIEQRLCILEDFYNQIDKAINNNSFYNIEDIIETFTEEDNFQVQDNNNFKFDKTVLNDFFSKEFKDKVKGVGFKSFMNEYELGVSNITEEEYIAFEEALKSYAYIFENYLVNQIFKNLIPFNKSNGLMASIKSLKYDYILIKSYIIGVLKNSQKSIDEDIIIKIIQALSKDIEHNKNFKI